LKAKTNFHQETTLSGRSILHTAALAKETGFTVHLWYIFVADTEIAKQRVRARVARGGHGVPDDIIERRSITSLNTLECLIPLCDEAWLYDNTASYNPVARGVNGKIRILAKNIPPHIFSRLQAFRE